MHGLLSLSCFVVAVTGTACSSSSPPPNCEAAVRHAASLPGGPPDIPEAVARCLRERWTATVRTCLAGARTASAAESCVTGREAPGSPEATASGAGATKRPAPTPGPAPARAPQGPFGSNDEALLNLNAIEKSNLAGFAENAQFVVGFADLTPAAPCCAASDHRCPAHAEGWSGPVWTALDFEMTRSHAFRYSYRSDGATYEARAVGDLACDGKTTTFVLRGKIVDGQPVAEVKGPIVN